MLGILRNNFKDLNWNTAYKQELNINRNDIYELNYNWNEKKNYWINNTGDYVVDDILSIYY